MIISISSGSAPRASFYRNSLILLIFALTLAAPPLQAATEPPLIPDDIEKALDQQIADIPEEKQEAVRREAKVQLLESITRQRRPQ